ncbi:MAG: low temperature requirement protein A [Cyanobacteriota bacterium]|nr:low temperature requirement protein A [Cyanobacteriota bacterium]
MIFGIPARSRRGGCQDLVFVVAVSQLAHTLSTDVTLKGFFGYVALFIPVWWAWIGTTFYANRFDSDDAIHRILMGLQMLAVAALAVHVSHGLGESSVGFALAYATSRLLLVLEYLWAGWHLSAARGLTQRYAAGFGLGVLLWLISAFVPPPLRFVLWAAGLAIDFATPLSASAAIQQFPPHAEHLPERFGLFTIIVLGEAIIAVVNGVSEMDWGMASTICAIAGFVTAFSLWWIYFENVSGSIFRLAPTSRHLQVLQLWLYIHLPLVIGLAALGVGVEKGIIYAGEVAVLPTPERWLLCGSVALCYAALAVLHRLGIIYLCKGRTRHRLGGMVAMLVLAGAGGTLSPVGIMTGVAFVGLVQVGLDVYQGKAAISLKIKN